MSGYLAGKVWQSDLDPELKPFAAALADIANDDGSSIYPTVEYVGWLIGVDRRTVQRAIANLRDRKILLLVRAGGGRGNPSEYRIDEEALPKRRPWKQEREARRAAEAGQEAPAGQIAVTETPAISYDDARLADSENSGITPPFTAEDRINSGVDVQETAAPAPQTAARPGETAAFGTQTAAPTPPDPSSDPSSDLDPSLDPSYTRNARASARSAGAAAGLRGANKETGGDPPEAGPLSADPAGVFTRTLANQIRGVDWATWFAGAGVEVVGDQAIVSVAPECCEKVRSVFAPKIRLAALAAGLARIEIRELAR